MAVWNSLPSEIKLDFTVVVALLFLAKIKSVAVDMPIEAAVFVPYGYHF